VCTLHTAQRFFAFSIPTVVSSVFHVFSVSFCTKYGMLLKYHFERTPPMKAANILVIDGQGGGIGRQIVEGIKERLPDAVITAVGTNVIATNAMMKAGADRASTGENAIIVNARTADFIVGPLGIVIADSLIGEISPAMAAAVGASSAVRLLIPMNMCNSIIVGFSPQPVKELISQAVNEILKICS